MTFDALSFLYIALGVGFLALVIFTCIALWHLIRVLKDVADASAYVRDTAESVSENVNKVGDKVADVVEHVADYVVKPLSVFQLLMNRVQPFVDMVAGFTGGAEKADEEEEDEKPKKRRRRTTRKRKK